MSVLDGWRHCPRCGADLEPREESVACPACGFVGWANAVPAVQAVLVRDGRVLLGRRTIEPGRGKWDLPGGFLGEDEHPLDGLRREVREETGLELEPTRFLGFWLEDYRDGRTVLCITWVARPTGGSERAVELEDLRWFAPDELPAPGEYAFPTYVEILSAWRDEDA